MRARFGDDIPVLCQGEDQITTLVRQFARDPRTCLFGTLTLWQGVDVPGSSCQLVIIDRIPFPRPDDPLASARSQAIARMGGNGFMAVSATHAALRLAQGAGRLVRRADDRGVVAFLDSRMMTARYAGFLQRSLPPFYPTTDKKMVLAALSRLDAMAPPPVAVEEPALRSLTGAARRRRRHGAPEAGRRGRRRLRSRRAAPSRPDTPGPTSRTRSCATPPTPACSSTSSSTTSSCRRRPSPRGSSSSGSPSRRARSSTDAPHGIRDRFSDRTPRPATHRATVNHSVLQPDGLPATGCVAVGVRGPSRWPRAAWAAAAGSGPLWQDVRACCRVPASQHLDVLAHEHLLVEAVLALPVRHRHDLRPADRLAVDDLVDRRRVRSAADDLVGVGLACASVLVISALARAVCRSALAASALASELCTLS